MKRTILRLSCATLLTAAGIFCASCSTTAGTTATVAPATAIPQYIRDAVAAKDRPEAMTSRDKDRKPAELLALSGVKPGQHVVEFASFGQYFTTLLSPIVGPKGMVYMYDLPYTDARAGQASRDFVAKHPNCTYQLVDYNRIELPQNVDEVFMVLYYHDLGLNNIDTAALNAKIFKALKPGGIYFIVDHNARPGSGRTDTQKLHRIDPEVIRKEVLAAGFELVQESKLLANPEDDHSWMVFTQGKRGTTDQSIFKFRKPKNAK